MALTPYTALALFFLGYFFEGVHLPHSSSVIRKIRQVNWKKDYKFTVTSTPNLCGLQPGDLEVLPWLDHPVLESGRLAPELDLLDRPLQQLLPAGVQPHRPWNRLMRATKMHDAMRGRSIDI
jgi:hypothetical protein